VDDGIAVNSDKYNGLSTSEFKKKITADLEAAGLGKFRRELQAPRLDFQPPVVLGEPFPIAHCETCERSDCRKISFLCSCRTLRILGPRQATIRPLRRSRRWGA